MYKGIVDKTSEIGKSKWLALKLPRAKCYDTVLPFVSSCALKRPFSE